MSPGNPSAGGSAGGSASPADRPPPSGAEAGGPAGGASPADRPPPSGAEAGGQPASPGDLTIPDQILAQVTKERDDYLDQLQRRTAEFQNLKRRNEETLQTRINKGVSSVVESLLPVLDACDAAALQGASEQVAPIAQLLWEGLRNAGLERIEALGAVFDPNEHEAVSFAASQPGATDSAGAGSAGAGSAAAADPGEQIVVEEFRAGYRFNGQVLRATQVIVGTRAAQQSGPSPSGSQQSGSQQSGSQQSGPQQPK